MDKWKEVAQFICDILNELPDTLQNEYCDRWNKLVDKYKRWDNGRL